MLLFAFGINHLKNIFTKMTLFIYNETTLMRLQNLFSFGKKSILVLYESNHYITPYN